MGEKSRAPGSGNYRARRLLCRFGRCSGGINQITPPSVALPYRKGLTTLPYTDYQAYSPPPPLLDSGGSRFWRGASCVTTLRRGVRALTRRLHTSWPLKRQRVLCTNMWSVKEGSTSDGGPAARKLDGKVDVQQLLDFIFPKSLQHPLSTGRLFAFAMYGPLDSNTNLRSGHNGQRVVSTWEIDTMCLQFEREDLLQVGGCFTETKSTSALQQLPRVTPYHHSLHRQSVEFTVLCFFVEGIQ